MRKTISVDSIRERVNTRIAHREGTADSRRALGALLESILHDSGNYKGFRYLDGFPCADESRVEYFG
jgi:hypothetical protein